MISRQILPQLATDLAQPGKAVLLYGARRVGKTTLVRTLLSSVTGRVLEVNADELRVGSWLSARDLRRLREELTGYDTLFVDEAQRIPEIGITLKLIVDNLPIRVIATGSSSLELASQTRESLTGRAWTHQLFPIGICELAQIQTIHELKETLPERLVYGGYPEVVGIPSRQGRERYLRELVSSYLYKDVLELADVRHPLKLPLLLRLLAFQTGQEVSYAELGTQLGMTRDTVLSYISLLEQSFVLFRLHGFSRNLRKEISKRDKIFFWDNGVRNALIDDFKSLDDRFDHGQLWENFMISERRKWMTYSRGQHSAWFWRTPGGSEVDLVEEYDGQIHAFEYKWGASKARSPLAFTTTYPAATFAVIRPDGFWSHVSAKS